MLLCSDGLNDVLSSEEIAALLAVDAPLEVRCAGLVDAAIRAGGKDNTTVVLVEATASLAPAPNPPQPEFTWRYCPTTGGYVEADGECPSPVEAADAIPEGTVMMKAPPDMPSPAGPAVPRWVWGGLAVAVAALVLLLL